MQDCFTSAWKYRRQLRQPELARAWLFRIMRRHVLRHGVPGLQRLDENYGEFAVVQGVPCQKPQSTRWPTTCPEPPAQSSKPENIRRDKCWKLLF